MIGEESPLGYNNNLGLLCLVHLLVLHSGGVWYILDEIVDENVGGRLSLAQARKVVL